jgi:hypothetical protein
MYFRSAVFWDFTQRRLPNTADLIYTAVEVFNRVIVYCKYILWEPVILNDETVQTLQIQTASYFVFLYPSYFKILWQKT